MVLKGDSTKHTRMLATGFSYMVDGSISEIAASQPLPIEGWLEVLDTRRLRAKINA